ncbi:MAG: hypothetical protein PVG70_19920, partial [Desulfobacterales bacterium]
CKYPVLNPILFTLRESRCHPIFGVYPPWEVCQGIAVPRTRGTASPLDALKLGHPRHSPKENIYTRLCPLTSPFKVLA